MFQHVSSCFNSKDVRSIGKLKMNNIENATKLSLY